MSMQPVPHDRRGLLDAPIGDDRPQLKLTALALIGSGLFAFFLRVTGQFLPHEFEYLGMTANQIRSIADS